MLFPAAQATIVDVWHVTGLRGTGSDAFTVTDLFVPHAHSVSRDDPAERRHPGPLYCFPSGSLYASGFSGVAMGLARSSLDAFVELARDKEPRSSKPPRARQRAHPVPGGRGRGEAGRGARVPARHARAHLGRR